MDSPRCADDLIAGSGLPRLEARVLLEAACGRPREWLLAHGDEALPQDLLTRALDLLGRRRAGEPLAYLTGWREFRGHRFEVDPAVLIPRPETERLVELALERLAAHPGPGPAEVADLGTGSGAIAVSLALARPDARVTATDLSAAALAVATRNATRLGARVHCHQGAWFDALPSDARFDLLVSNPPYIASDDRHLQEGDLRFEPRTALTDEADGLRHLRTLATGATAHLKPGGWILLEHGWDQGPAVRELLTRAGLANAITHVDDEGRDRVSCAQRRAALE